ncbi:MAG TPA: hypothetical protein VMW55_01170 [Nitrosopumilaceae archaeon]|nr:hypothetical protein [Nitrosopumilaceae archaeon]
MIFNNSQKLLAGTLALIMVAGMTSPAFAGAPSDPNLIIFEKTSDKNVVISGE